MYTSCDVTYTPDVCLASLMLSSRAVAAWQSVLPRMLFTHLYVQQWDNHSIHAPHTAVLKTECDAHTYAA